MCQLRVTRRPVFLRLSSFFPDDDAALILLTIFWFSYIFSFRLWISFEFLKGAATGQGYLGPFLPSQSKTLCCYPLLIFPPLEMANGPFLITLGFLVFSCPLSEEQKEFLFCRFFFGQARDRCLSFCIVRRVSAFFFFS